MVYDVTRGQEPQLSLFLSTLNASGMPRVLRKIPSVLFG